MLCCIGPDKFGYNRNSDNVLLCFYVRGHAHCWRKMTSNITILCLTFLYYLLARDVIYTSRAYAMMPGSVCPSVYPSVLWRLCTVVYDGSRISLHAWIDGGLYYLLTAWSGLSDGMMLGFLVEDGGMKKVVIVAISLILLIFYRWTITTWHICLYERVYERYLIFFPVISVENALCQKTVRLITTSA